MSTSGGLPRSVRAGYGAGSVATGAFGTVPGLMLLPFLTDSLGIAAGLAGLIVFLPKAWDVVLNPIAGRISDRHHSPLGPRRPFLLRAGIALAIAFSLIFAVPDLGSKVGEAAWVLVAFVAAASAYAFFQVPYVAMPAEMTDSYDERTRLMAWRVALLAATIMFAGATAPIIRNQIGGRDGYRAMGVVMALVILAGALAAYFGTRRAPVRAAEPGPGSLADQLRIVAGARDFRMLLTAFVLQAVATGVMLAGVDYVANDVLGSAAAGTILFVAFLAPALLLMPLWSRLGERLGKRTGYTLSSLVLAAGAALTLSALVAPPWVVYLATLLVGAGYAGAQAFPLAMLPDTAAVDAARTGTNRVGVYTGVWTAAETFGLALAPFLFSLVLVAGGYVSGTDSDVVQPESAQTAIVLGFSLLPAALVLVSLVWLRRYTLDARTVETTGVTP